MPNLISLLSERFQEKKSKVDKMNELAERSHQGQLSSFSGVFQIPDITEDDRKELDTILQAHAHDDQETHTDFHHLLTITSEIKAINNQAIMLHGERIQKAQTILKKYKDGAFTRWLISTYGNRQTPYNFLLFYEFYSSLDDPLKKLADAIPKQVIYSLSSRKAPEEKKKAFLQAYQGETKQVLLKKLRDTFPLKKEDKRRGKNVSKALALLEKLDRICSSSDFMPTLEEKRMLKKHFSSLEKSLHD